MSSLEEIKKNRIEKLKRIQESGIDPYPAETHYTHQCQEIIDHFTKLSSGKKEIILAGRIISIREHGGSTFANIQDGSASLQIYLKKDELGEKEYKFFQANFDIGDFIEASGSLFLTGRGEKTLLVKKYRLLSKSLAPLPEKWHGLKEVEERFRKRYLDLLMNKEVKENFIKRTEIIKSLRKFLDERGFVEVETPILQTIPGGASARPFVTHHHALDIDLYLRIAPELYLKRLLVGGLEKVYEIGRCFRNEGLDSTHNPDFTTLEFYEAYSDYEKFMEMTEEMVVYVLKSCGCQDIPCQRPFKRVEFSALGRNDDELKAKIKEITEPTFIIHHPTEISPLAKSLVKEPTKTARFQLVINGLELANAFSELNDPLEQKKRFQKQEENLRKGDQEAQRYDQDFIEALEYGMPPAAGLGLGIDRFVALLTKAKSLREVILFPLMKPKE